MKRVKLVVAYDGTNYHGWQIQPNGITIESVLNESLSKLLGEDIHVIGASRTDSGVHALCNIAVFDTGSRIPGEKMCYALNQYLPEDIRIRDSQEVAPAFHPRRCASIKTYCYRIWNDKFPLPTVRLYSYFFYHPLNVELMEKAAACLVGEHDFKSFCSARTQAETTVRTITDIKVAREGNMVLIRVSGTGFLYNMVRIIVGTLLKVGLSVYPPEYVREILHAKDRAASGPVAPAKGLTLENYEFS